MSVVILLAATASCSPASDYEPTVDEFTGTAARDRILDLTNKTPSELPASASNFYVFDGGTFNGSITYWAFDCDNREDCITALKNLTGITEDQFLPWSQSKYAVVMHGPSYYFPALKTTPWQVDRISNGLVLERVRGTDWMDYFAIDLDRNRVYFHHESGGFPADQYDPQIKHRR